MAHYFPYDVKLRLLADSRSFLANQKARNAIVGAENLLKALNLFFGVPVCIDHFLVVFKEDNIKTIVSHGEIRDCDEIAKGASCEALWKDAKHREWYPAFIVEIGGETI